MISFKLDKSVELILIGFIRPYYKAKWFKHLASDKIWHLLLNCLFWEEHQETNDDPGEMLLLKQVGEPGFDTLLRNVRQQSINQSAISITPERFEQIANFLRNPNVVNKNRFVLPSYLKRHLSKNKSLAEQQEARRLSMNSTH